MVTCDYDYGVAAALATINAGEVAFSSCAAGTKFGIVGIGPLAFTMATGTPDQGAVLAEWAYNKKNWKRAYVLLDDTGDYARKLEYYFSTRWKELAGESGWTKDVFIGTDTSFATQVTKLKEAASNVDFIFMASFGSQGAPVIRQIRAAGIDLPILSSESMDGTYWLEGVPNLSNFYYATYASIYGDDPNPKMNEILARYQKEFGQNCLTAHCLTGYSVGEALAKAFTMAGTTKGEEVKKALETFKDVPLLVGATTFTDKLHMTVTRPMRIIQIQNGKPSYYDMTDAPQKVPDIIE